MIHLLVFFAIQITTTTVVGPIFGADGQRVGDGFVHSLADAVTLPTVLHVVVSKFYVSAMGKILPLRLT